MNHVKKQQTMADTQDTEQTTETPRGHPDVGFTKQITEDKLFLTTLKY